LRIIDIVLNGVQLSTTMNSRLTVFLKKKRSASKGVSTLYPLA